MRRLLTELLGFVMSAGFYNFLRPHTAVGVLMIELRGFVIKPTFFNSGKTYSVICLEPQVWDSRLNESKLFAVEREEGSELISLDDYAFDRETYVEKLARVHT